MPKQEKVDMVQELIQDIEKSSALLMSDYRGLKVSQITTFRRKLRDLGAEYKIVKNTLFERAADATGDTGLGELLAGPTAVVFVHEDPVAAAKALVDFARESKIMTIKGGYVEGHVYNVDQIQALSKIPSKEVLISQMLGSIQAPISGLVGTLQGVISNLVYTLQAVADKQAA